MPERELQSPDGISEHATVEKTIAQQKTETRARLAKILERGHVQDRLYVELPDDMHGEWVYNDPVEVEYKRTIGFEIDRDYAHKRGLHADEKGSGAATIGDVIFMTCPKYVKEVIDEIRAEQYRKANDPKRQREERDYENSANSLLPVGIKPLNDTKTHQVDGKDLSAIVAAAAVQNDPSKQS